MTKNRLMRLLAALLALALVAAACGSDDDESSENVSAEDGADDDGAADDGASDDGAADDGAADDGAADDGASDDSAADDGGGAATGLAAVCPDPLVVQTDWFPEAEHGAMYELVGDDYEVDVDNKIVRGSMVLGGQDLGIGWEVRTGGPAIGFAPVASYMYTDDSIHLGYATTDGQVLRFEEAPLLSVVSPLEQNPQIIMWDPATYPEVNTIADLGEADVTVNVFAGGTFAEVFVAQGIWSSGQVDPSYDGSPARFISEGGSIAQQGFASAEPFTYEFEFEEWGKPVNFQTLHDAGFQVYSQTIGVKPDELETLRPCLEQVVPIIQQAVIDYSASPDRANAIIVDAVERYADFWVYNAPLAEYSIETQNRLGLVGNGPDATVGNMEEGRIQTVIDQIRDAGLDVPDDLTAAEIFTNEFIDSSIGFPEPEGPSPEEVQAVQEALTAVGCYSGPVDGAFGPETEQAIRDFQAAKGLTVDGVIGPETVAALEDAVANGETVCETGGGDGGDDGAADDAGSDGTDEGADDGDDGAADDGAADDAGSDGTDEGADDGGDGGGTVATVNVTTSDGVNTTMDITSCTLSDGGVELTAQTETSNITVSAGSGSGPITFQSAEGSSEGTVDSVTTNSETNEFTASGTLTAADDSAEPATVSMAGTCPEQ